MSDRKDKLVEKLKQPGELDEQVRKELLAVLLQADRSRPISYEEFLTWADEDTLAEWVEGEVQMSTPASERHQDISDFLVSLLRLYVEFRQMGRVISAPFQMRLKRSGREPDLLFVAEEHLHRLRDTYLDGPADLVIEILSPESAGRDRGEKFFEYEQAGIREYWLIDPERERAEFYQLDERGHYQQVLTDAEGVYTSPVLAGFRLPMSWLWKTPHVLDALRKLDLV